MFELDLRTILEMAVKVEEQSYMLYSKAQERAKYRSSKSFLKELAQEELKHKAKLLAMMEDAEKLAELGQRGGKVQNLSIVDLVRNTTLSEDADYQRILIFAAKREKTTSEYYDSLATGLADTDVGTIFSRLAQEELEHKNKLEREYDEYVLKEN